MSCLLNKVTKYLLYQRPPEPPAGFTAGTEDRPGEDAREEKQTEEKGSRSGHGRRRARPVKKPAGRDAGKPEETGEPGDAGKNINPNGSPGGAEQAGGDFAVQEKYAGLLAENRAVDELLRAKTGLAYDLEENRRVLARVFRVPRNKDVVLRSLTIGADPPVKALLVFVDGVVNSQVQNLAVLQPLMLLSGICAGVGAQPRGNGGPAVRYKDFFDRVKEALLPNNQVAVADNYQKVVGDVLGGNSALFIDGFNQALLLETKGWNFRSISPPQVEAVIRGPQEAFTEQIRINTSLVRKIIQRPALVTEFIKVGEASPMQCAVMYMVDVANPGLVHEVKRRLEALHGEYLQQSGLLEQMIEDSPLHLVPQVLATERPDRVAAGIMEGKVAVLVDGNPFVLVVPSTFFDLMQSPEDAYVRWPLGAFIRIVRYAGLFLAMLLPAHYVAITAYHQEFIPTDLLLAMTGAREKVPFPSIVEILIMEASFELIREAGIRIPGTVGTTLGIVGALILGQAAVAANIVSPILIIVVAVTAIGSFAIPNYSLSLSIRVLRFVYIILGALSGMLGILVGFFIHVGLMVNLRSFGAPFMAPAAPVTRNGQSYFYRGPVWRQETRPDYIDPLQRRLQPRISRGWLRSGRENRKKGDE